MRSNIVDALLSRNIIRGYNRYRTIKQTLGGTFTMDADMPHILFLDPGGADRTVLLPAETDGLWYVIVGTGDADETLTVKEDSNTTTIGTVGRGGVNMFWCNGTTWYESQTIEQLQAATAQNLLIETVSDDKQVRINSRSYTQASGDSIGFQSKPSQTVTTTGTVRGGEVSPRLQSGIGAAELAGLQVYPTLKGSAAAAITGDVLALDVLACEDDQESPSGTPFTIAGDVIGMKVRSNFTVNPTGHVVPFKIMTAEKANGTWDALFKFQGTQAGSWNADPGTELDNPGGTVKGYIKVLFGSTARYIALYEAGNLAD